MIIIDMFSHIRRESRHNGNQIEAENPFQSQIDFATGLYFIKSELTKPNLNQNVDQVLTKLTTLLSNYLEEASSEIQAEVEGLLSLLNNLTEKIEISKRNIKNISKNIDELLSGIYTEVYDQQFDKNEQNAKSDFINNISKLNSSSDLDNSPDPDILSFFSSFQELKALIPPYLELRSEERRSQFSIKDLFLDEEDAITAQPDRQVIDGLISNIMRSLVLEVDDFIQIYNSVLTEDELYSKTTAEVRAMFLEAINPPVPPLYSEEHVGDAAAD